MNALIRMLTLPVFVTAATALLAEPAAAQNPPWCATMDNDGTTQCNFYTEQQCLQSVSGIGGVCTPNPAGSGPQPAPNLPSSENAQGLLPLQLQNPGPPPGLGGSATQGPPNN
jgi:Protein of unknown function (DUF3551)